MAPSPRARLDVYLLPIPTSAHQRLRCAAVLLFQPKYRLGHPENYYFSLCKKTFLDQGIQQKKKKNLENRGTGAMPFRSWERMMRYTDVDHRQGPFSTFVATSKAQTPEMCMHPATWLSTNASFYLSTLCQARTLTAPQIRSCMVPCGSLGKDRVH